MVVVGRLRHVFLSFENSFYNSMWLVANDIIIGVAIGSYLMGNRYAVSNTVHVILKVRRGRRARQVFNHPHY